MRQMRSCYVNCIHSIQDLFYINFRNRFVIKYLAIIAKRQYITHDSWHIH